MTQPTKPKRSEGQWALGDREPLNANEEFKLEDPALNVRARVEEIYSKQGFDSIDKTDLRGRFRWWGLYTQRVQGYDGTFTGDENIDLLEAPYFMLRVRSDGGALTAAALRTVGTLATEFARDTADISDRQNVQYHWIRVEDMPEIWNRLDAVGLQTTEACGDCPRVVLGSPLAGESLDEVLDATPAIDEIVRRYKEETSGLKNRPVFEFPLTPPDSGVPSGALILVAILLGMIVYGAWYAIAGSDRGNIEVVQAVPERLTTEVAPPPAEGAAPQADISAEEDSEAIAAAAPRDPSVAGEAGPGEPEAGVVAPAISPPTQIAAVPAPPVSTDVVELRAKSDVWITLKSQGKTDRTQMLKKGEVLRAPEGGGGMTLVTAKPSDLEILVNGTVMPQGDAGLFAKGVPLDPAQFKGAPAAPATPPQQKTPTANPSGAQ